ncbi:ribonuclease [Rhizobiaceae bacterium BDR2-2]|uniref:Ribonuclease n=1 Tax=Ectorhizobium quercum TaxID=2965071 RepID=A0AAE3N2J0_9HYPH|nr:ribonuclease [Ectorhizobium quercum]MCX8999006.1 ribonuclease [Ectorhizobium quercum]
MPVTLRKALPLVLAAVFALGAYLQDRAGTDRTADAPAADGDTAPTPDRAPAQVPAGSGFDFYVLSLSWSPTFCQSGQARDGDPQCDPGRARGFVVHGLWPQNERGYPEFCPSSEPQRVPAAIGRELSTFMPSMGLIGHQWRKHGTCSGLSQREYFSVLAAAFGRLEIPKPYSDGRTAGTVSPGALEQAFIDANPGLSPGGIAVTCDGRRLEEIRICMTRDLRFRDCREVDQRACRIDTVTIPTAR